MQAWDPWEAPEIPGDDLVPERDGRCADHEVVGTHGRPVELRREPRMNSGGDDVEWHHIEMGKESLDERLSAGTLFYRRCPVNSVEKLRCRNGGNGNHLLTERLQSFCQVELASLASHENARVYQRPHRDFGTFGCRLLTRSTSLRY